MYIINNLRFNFRIFLIYKHTTSTEKSAKVFVFCCNVPLLHFFHTNIVHYTLFLCKNNFTDYHKRKIIRLDSFIRLDCTKNKLYKTSFQGLFQEISSYRSKTVNQNSRLQTNAAMQISVSINTVSRFHNLLFITHCKLKFTTYHISRLRVVMRVRSSYSPFLKFDFNQHYLPIIAHNLSGHTFTCRLPRFFFLMPDPSVHRARRGALPQRGRSSSRPTTSAPSWSLTADRRGTFIDHAVPRSDHRPARPRRCRSSELIMDLLRHAQEPHQGLCDRLDYDVLPAIRPGGARQKLDILLVRQSRSTRCRSIVHKDAAYDRVARALCEKLKDIIPQPALRSAHTGRRGQQDPGAPDGARASQGRVGQMLWR